MPEIPRHAKNRTVSRIGLGVKQSPEETQKLNKLMDRFRILERRFINRHNVMCELESYYNGQYFMEERNADITGHKITVNVVANTVDSYRQHLSSPFDHDVPARGADSASHAEANRNEALIYGIDETNRMNQQIGDAVHYMTLKGVGIFNWFIDPQSPEQPIVINLQDPQYVFVAHSGTNVREITEVFLRFPITVQQFRDDFNIDDRIGFFSGGQGTGIAPSGGFRDAEGAEVIWITSHRDKKENNIIFNDSALLTERGFVHDYGLVPWVFAPNMGSPHNVMGKPDVADIIEMGEYYNALLSHQADIIELHADPMVHVKGSTGEQTLQSGPGTVWQTGADTDIRIIAATGAPPDVAAQLTRIRREIDFSGGIADLTQQGTVPARATGNTVKNMQSGLSARLAQKQHSLGGALQSMYKDILVTLRDKFPNLTLEYDTAKKGEIIFVDMKGKDIGKSVRNFVEWQPNLGDKLSQQAAEIQKFQSGLQSARTTMEKTGTRDPEFEMDEILSDQITQLSMQNELAAFQQGGVPNAPEQVQSDQESLVRGGVPGGAAAGPGPTGGVPPTGADTGGGDLVSAIRNLGVPGSIFLTQDKDSGDMIIAVTNAGAKTAIEQLLQQLGSDIKVIRVRKKPAGDSEQIQ